MNRRSFFSTLAAATAGFTILPAATTYGRIWKAERVIKPTMLVLNPQWVSARYVMQFMWHDAARQKPMLESELPRFNELSSGAVPIWKWIEQ